MKKLTLLLMCLLLLAMPVSASLPEAEFCAAVDVLFSDAAGWQKVEWSDAAYERGELPSDFRQIAFIYLTDSKLPDEQVQALQIEWSKERQEFWLIAFWSMTYRDGGQHDFCPVRKRRL